MITGFGGNLNSGSSRRKAKKNGYENLDQNINNITEDGSTEDDEEQKLMWAQNKNN
jgi:hypothetical protein